MFKPILRLGWFCCLTVLLLPEQQAVAGITVAPYVSIKSTKSISPNAKDSTQENSKVKQRQEMGWL